MATTKTIQATVKNRTDTVTNWTQKNPVLTEGEIIVVQMSAGETRLKIGDGTKTFTQLPYIDEQIYNNVVTSVNGQTGDVTLPGDFVVNATLTDDNNCTLDKTYAQIQEAVQAGKRVVAKVTDYGIDFVLPLIAKNNTGYLFAILATIFPTVTICFNIIAGESETQFYQEPVASLDSSGNLVQNNMDRDPEQPMEIATKQYVDNNKTANTVLYTAQALTDGQKKQARDNVGAWEAYNGALPIVCEYDKYFPTGAKGTTTLYVSSGELLPPASDASAEILDAWKYFMNIATSSAPASPSVAQRSVSSIGLLAAAGVFGKDFLATTGNTFEVTTDPNMPDATLNVVVSNSAKQYITVFANYARVGIHYNMSYTIPTASFDADAYFYKQLELMANSSSAVGLNLSQQTMASAPTADMQIATKKYVDDKISDKELILSSSTAGSTKKFKLTIDDTGTLTASEVTA